MKCAIIYNNGKFRFKCGDVNFAVPSDGDTSELFDVLSALLILEHTKGKYGIDKKWESILKKYEDE